MKHVVVRPTAIIQHITTTWTKASRGGINATARNSTPEVLPLPIPSDSSSSGNILIHSIIYDEKDCFHSSQERLEQIERTEPFRYNCLKISFLQDTLQVRVEWENIKGVPRRSAFLRQAFSLQNQQWICVKYNQRFSLEDRWVYENQILNVGIFPVLSRDVFFFYPCTRRYSEMAQLR